ncbi:hypothetical protein YSY43_15550 [Paenibacillus sp. YSY-4.3]
MFKNINKETLSHTTLAIGTGIILTTMVMVITRLTLSIIIITIIMSTTTVQIGRSKLHDNNLKRGQKQRREKLRPDDILNIRSVTFSPFITFQWATP